MWVRRGLLVQLLLAYILALINIVEHQKQQYNKMMDILAIIMSKGEHSLVL